MDQDMSSSLETERQLQGDATVSRLRDLNFRFPVVMRTSSCDYEMLQAYKNAGADAILPKQLHPKLLKPLLSSTLERISMKDKAKGFGLLTLQRIKTTRRISRSFSQKCTSNVILHPRSSSTHPHRLEGDTTTMEGDTTTPETSILSPLGCSRRTLKRNGIKSATCNVRKLGCSREMSSPLHHKFRDLARMGTECKSSADIPALQNLSRIMERARRTKIKPVGVNL